MTSPAPWGGNFVDPWRGPLVGAGRLGRVLPFAVTATVSVCIALPATNWIRPGFAWAGSIVIATMIVGSLAFPWHRVPRNAQLTPPLLFLIGTMLLENAVGNGIGSPFVTLSILPLMWLAIYENKLAVLFAAAVAGAALAVTVPTGDNTQSTSGVVAIAVFVVVGAGAGFTLHDFVAQARRGWSDLNDNTVALEQSATILNALPELVSRYRVSDHVITYCNATWAKQYDVHPEDAVGRKLDDFLSADEAEGLVQQLSLLGPDNPILVDSTARATDGAERKWLEWVDRYIVTPHGPEILSIGRDVTRRRKAELDLAETEAGFRDLADRSADVVWRFSLEPTPHFDYMSPSVEALSGYPPSYFLEDFSRILDVLDDTGATIIARALKGEPLPDRFDIRFRHANGSISIAETLTSTIRGGLQGVSRDVTEIRRLQENLQALALRDPLTGLANRRLFNELLDADVARTQRSGSPLAIAFLDLDGLKYVNDVYGHDAGDIVLRETGRRLLKIVRGADTVARLGGDEFAIVYAPNDAHSHNLIARIDRALEEPINITSTTAVTCPASIGVAHTSTSGYDSAALLADADEAMYESKRARHAAREVGTVMAHSQ